METMENYKCPCCGAPLKFEPKSQKLGCLHCDNVFSLETIQQMTEDEAAASEASKYDWESYTPREFEDVEEFHLVNFVCPSCGAQLSGDNTMGSTVCPYCGNATIVRRQFKGALRPDYIIPFQVTKKEAIGALEKDFKKRPFLPDHFKDQKKIEEMAGVYVPFWMFDCDCNASATFRAQRIRTWSDAKYDYTKINHYRLFRRGRAEFSNVPVDASKKADDTYMQAIEPYRYDDAVEFSPGYLSGFLADRYDVDAKESSVRANERVVNSTIDALYDTAGFYINVIPETSSASISNGKVRYALLPVWMLNIKFEDKMYQFAVNGQTGKVVGEYPVDKGKKWKFFAKVAGVAYAAAAVIGWMLLH